MYHYAISFGDKFIVDPQWQDALKKSNIKKIEFSCGQTIPDDLKKQELQILSQLQDKSDVEVASIHIPFAPFDVWTLADLDENRRKAGTRQILDFMKFFQPLHSPIFTLHGSGEPILPETRKKAIQSVRRSIEELLPYLSQAQVMVNIEILPRTCLGHDVDEIEEITADFPPEYVGICCDVNHFGNCHGKVPQFIRRLSSRIRSFHLSDYDGVDECHWYPGLGLLDWSAIMTEIKAIKQETLLILECSDFVRPPACFNRAILPELVFRNNEKNIFFLEHVKEFNRDVELFCKKITAGR